jgi:hypothetical protein
MKAEKELSEKEALEKMERERTELMRLKQSAKNSRPEDVETIARLKPMNICCDLMCSD